VLQKSRESPGVLQKSRESPEAQLTRVFLTEAGVKLFTKQLVAAIFS